MQDFKYLEIAKENLKFSVAHFLIFDETRAEKLHGHNYRVKFGARVPSNLNEEKGYSVDFSVLKKIIKDQLDLWDEHVVLPELHKEMNYKWTETSLEVRFRNRFYVFPKDEVLLLPISNTSVELLSGLLCEIFWGPMKSLGVLGLRVEVEETLGQSGVSVKGLWG